MCIIAWKNIGVEMPNETVLKECFTTNSHGAGFAHYDSSLEMWIARKGFMKWLDFWRAIQFMQYQPQDAVMMHFRISTSGKRSHPDCTHPFPISFDKEDLNAHSFETENIVMHNGVVGPGDGDLSDTQVAILKYLAPLFPFIEEPGVEDIVGDLLKDSSCRWLLARKEDVMMYGTWHKGEEHAPGVLFSNRGFLPPVVYNNRRTGNWNQGRGSDPVPFDRSIPPGGTNQNISGGGGSYGVPPAVYEKTILVPLEVSDTKAKYTTTTGWDWKKWDIDYKEPEEKITYPSLLINAPSLVEVFDLHGELEAVVDEEGNIMWNDGVWVEVVNGSLSAVEGDELPIEVKKQILTNGVDFIFECPTCGNNISVRKLNIHGECCFCYSEVLNFEEMMNVSSSNGGKYICPTCNESHRLVDSPFNVGDILCELCGAVFVVTDGRSETVMFDYDIARQYKISKSTMGV